MCELQSSVCRCVRVHYTYVRKQTHAHALGEIPERFSQVMVCAQTIKSIFHELRVWVHG